MRDFIVGTLTIGLGGAIGGLAFILAFDVVPGIIARMNPIHCSLLFVAMMVLPFSKWIGEGVRDSLRSRTRSRIR
ncbi:MAG: hypothetical protein NDI61_07970 [Bdellovibrionaceae bacterium]|nr:hypothetical protein [Pseudobdellovibrionaceae bacterium]